MTAVGSETARATISRMDLWVGSRLMAVRHSTMKRSRSNTAMAPFPLGGRLCRGFGAMPLLMKIIGSIKFQHEIAIDRWRITRRVVGADAGWSACDHRSRVGAVEVGDRIAVSP